MSVRENVANQVCAIDHFIKQTNNNDLVEKDDCTKKILSYTWINGLVLKVSSVHIDCFIGKYSFLSIDQFIQRENFLI